VPVKKGMIMDNKQRAVKLHQANQDLEFMKKKLAMATTE
jgi:hypothetical protein